MERTATTGRLVGLLVLACVAQLATAEPRQVSPDSLEIEDADTLLVEVAGNAYRIQLPGIDAPENTHNPKLQRDMARTGLDAAALLPLGAAADDGLRALLADFGPYRLHFDPDDRDRYGRIRGDLVDARGQTLSRLLVEQGYAVPVAGGQPVDPVLSEALASARQAGRGLWGSHAEVAGAWAAPAK